MVDHATHRQISNRLQLSLNLYPSEVGRTGMPLLATADSLLGYSPRDYNVLDAAWGRGGSARLQSH